MYIVREIDNNICGDIEVAVASVWMIGMYYVTQTKHTQQS